MYTARRNYPADVNDVRAHPYNFRRRCGSGIGRGDDLMHLFAYSRGGEGLRVRKEEILHLAMRV